MTDVGPCRRSLLSNLRELSLGYVAISAAALQSVATRLQKLSLTSVSLKGSADGLLTAGWTALTSLFFSPSCEAEDTMCSALELPALERMVNHGSRHRGGVLQLDQLTGSCPRLRDLEFNLAGPSEASWQSCRLSDLSRLTHLCITQWPGHASPDLDLPASLTSLRVQGLHGGTSVDLCWLLREARKCVRRGAQLHTLCCNPAEVQEDASLEEQLRPAGSAAGQPAVAHSVGWHGGAGQRLQRGSQLGTPAHPRFAVHHGVAASHGAPSHLQRQPGELPRDAPM